MMSKVCDDITSKGTALSQRATAPPPTPTPLNGTNTERYPRELKHFKLLATCPSLSKKCLDALGMIVCFVS